MTQTERTGKRGGPGRASSQEASPAGYLSALPKWRADLSRVALFWELLWPALWPALGLIGFYLLLGLAGLPQALPAWAHAAVLAAFALVLAANFWRGFQSLRLPSRHAALRRIERVNNLDHRPLESLEDALGTGHGDAAARTLWRIHQERLRAAAARLRIGWPRPGLIRRDPLALRVGLCVALIAAFVSTGEEAWERIGHAFSPDVGGLSSAPPPKLDAWISPPEYTRQAPVFLTQERTAAEAAAAAPAGEIKVPEGSKLVLRLSGGRDVPQLVTPGGPTPLDAEDRGGFHLEATLDKSGRFAVTQREAELAGWDITVVPDESPTVSFTRDPGQSARKALRLDFAAQDDYGVERVVAKIIGSGALASESALAKLVPTEIELTLPGQKSRDIKSTSYHDLTPHPWAGLPVNLQLVAQDGVGQHGVSKSVQVVLPEREFAHPIARAIIDQRRRLALYPEENRARVAAMLEIIAWDYERYREDYVVFMSLISSARRLGPGYEGTPEHVAGVLKLLWDTALRIEDGTLSLSEQSLREAQQALQDALSKDETTDAEIDRLMREFEKALDEYMKSLAELMRNNPDLMKQLPQMDPQAMMLSREDLKKMMDQIRELARSGQRDAARQMLSQMQQMLENLRMRRFAQPNQQQQQAMQMLNDLQDILKQQQQLLDKTFREAQRRGQMRGGSPSQRFPPNMMPPGQPQQQPGAEDSSPMDSESQAQEELRRRLGELMRQLGEMSGNIPRPLGRAERSMRESTDQLGEGQAGQAVPPQSEAIDQLQQGAREATQQLMQQLSRSGQMRPGPGQPTGEAQDRERDPFGRDAQNAGRGMNTEDVKVPDLDKAQDARRIRDELRRRAGQRARPTLELDYIERLLRQF
jgi:uncharacterized protein (TIGR02302 family)